MITFTLTLDSVKKYEKELGNYYDIMIIFYSTTKTYPQISECLNIPIGTVKSRLNRGKSILFKLIKQENESAKIKS